MLKEQMWFTSRMVTGSRVKSSLFYVAGWNSKPAKGIYQGIAIQNFQNTASCFVAEASLINNAYVKVHRVVCAIDCGIVIKGYLCNPLTERVLLVIKITRFRRFKMVLLLG